MGKIDKKKLVEFYNKSEKDKVKIRKYSQREGERERDWERVPSFSRGATIVLSEEMQNFKKVKKNF